MRNGERRPRGFTLIELLVTLAIIGLLVAIAMPRYFGNLDKAKEDVLREDLYVIRDAIDKYFSDHNRFPDAIDELVTTRYLRKLPVDPFTQSSRTWVPVAPADATLGAVADVHSGASNTGRDGTWLKDW